jgi:hypothetical protein
MVTVQKPGPSQTKELPQINSIEHFRILFQGGKSQDYAILRFRGSTGPNLIEAVEIANSMKKDMLTRQDAEAIRDGDLGIFGSFKIALKLGEWSYVRDPKSEDGSHATCFAHNGINTGLSVYDGNPRSPSYVMILKEKQD